MCGVVNKGAGDAEAKIDVKVQPTGTVTAALKSGGPLKKDDASTNAVVILTIESDSGLAFSDELPAEQFTLSGGSKGSLAAAAPTKKNRRQTSQKPSSTSRARTPWIRPSLRISRVTIPRKA